MNIPWFVSNGYLVFCPDIHFTVGDPGKSAFNYVVSAAEMISEKPWVNARKMGIQGHSFGAYEVNYLITRTKLFAAAASAEGASDLVSFSGALGVGGVKDSHSTIEDAQYRMGATIWGNPSSYIRNSPVFQLDKVETPLLIMDNKNDNVIPWSQGMELFAGLHRLDKKVWMLQYDNGYHQLINDLDRLDYSIRLSQFFDFYLRGGSAPKWMSEGVPASLKGIDSGLELGEGDK
jgi:dipeptidyl aminopeptidase/acylaminoacyl peptidase